jgi:opacity protein-like surface antigen
MDVKKLGCILLLTAVSCSSFAFSPNFLKDVEISAGTGIDWLHADNGTMVVAPPNVNSEHVSHTVTSMPWKCGIGYHAFADRLAQNTYLNDLLLQVNMYHSSGALQGEVYQYPSDNYNYNFRAPANSTRVMFDIKPVLFTYHDFSPYGVVGIGETWNKLSYYEISADPDNPPDSAYNLGSHTTAQLAYDVGAGVRRDFTSHLSASVEYLYSSLGKSSAATDSGNLPLAASPKFNLRTQSVMLGVSWKF